jgi:hypothetical protein
MASKTLGWKMIVVARLCAWNTQQAGTQRSRILATLYKDERCFDLPEWGMLEASHLGKIIKQSAKENFAKGLCATYFYPLWSFFLSYCTPYRMWFVSLFAELPVYLRSCQFVDVLFALVVVVSSIVSRFGAQLVNRTNPDTADG